MNGIAMESCATISSCLVMFELGLSADSLFLVAEPRYLKDLCILDFHSKSPDLVTIILDLSKVTVPEE